MKFGLVTVYSRLLTLQERKKILLRYCKIELESLHVKVCEKCLLSQLQIEGRWR